MRQNTAAGAESTMVREAKQHKRNGIIKAFPQDTTALEVDDSTMTVAATRHVTLRNAYMRDKQRAVLPSEQQQHQLRYRRRHMFVN